ncbi:hypothetical protein ACG93T_03530 [Acinetobacter beijerinckii]|uniref:hypothetical protein n=2 Tax=Moraxellaceae TaxID=468 RepID=UPI000BDEBACA|nr:MULTISPECIES: hypothetical protein [Acinetobacter]
MSNLNLSASFVPSDDELFSSLNSSTITINFLRLLLKKRGIIVAQDIDKIDLAKYISSLHLSYHEHELISYEYEKKRHRRDPSSGAWLESDLKLTDIESLIHKVKDSVFDETKIAINNIKVTNVSGKIRISTNYTKINPTKNAFARREIKEKYILITESDTGEYYIESPKDEDVDRIKEVFLKAIKDKDSSSNVTNINLMGMTDALDRIEFFDKLMREIESYEYKNLVDVSVSKPKEEDSNDDDDNEDNNDSEAFSEVAIIKRADFKGNYLRESEQLKKFLNEGFHTFRIVWEVIKDSDSNKEPVRLEAKFSNAENCTDFSYCVKGITQRGTDGKLKSNPSKLSNSEEEEINIRIYKAAKRIMAELYSKYSSPSIKPQE